MTLTSSPCNVSVCQVTIGYNYLFHYFLILNSSELCTSYIAYGGFVNILHLYINALTYLYLTGTSDIYFIFVLYIFYISSISCTLQFNTMLLFQLLRLSQPGQFRDTSNLILCFSGMDPTSLQTISYFWTLKNVSKSSKIFIGSQLQNNPFLREPFYYGVVSDMGIPAIVYSQSYTEL